MEEEKDTNLKSLSDDLTNINFDQKYTVVIEKDALAKGGYDFSHPSEFDKDIAVNPYCIVTYYFKSCKKHNPAILIETIEGDFFEDRKKIINHFVLHFALKYSTECDGLFK